MLSRDEPCFARIGAQPGGPNATVSNEWTARAPSFRLPSREQDSLWSHRERVNPKRKGDNVRTALVYTRRAARGLARFDSHAPAWRRHWFMWRCRRAFEPRQRGHVYCSECCRRRAANHRNPVRRQERARQAFPNSPAKACNNGSLACNTGGAAVSSTSAVCGAPRAAQRDSGLPEYLL